MTKEEILSLDGRELTRRLTKSLLAGSITKEQYQAVYDFWKKGNSNHLEEMVQEVFELEDIHN